MNLIKIASIASATLGLIYGVNTIAESSVPAEKFDLSRWKITLPEDKNNDGKVDEVDVRSLKKYSHPDFFYLDEKGYMVFAAPNRATTTSGSTNTRSELRQMLRGKKTSAATHSPQNNFVVKAHPQAKKFPYIGGKMQATLKVDHVPKNAKYPTKHPAYSVVIGQIHAGKNKGSNKLTRLGFGWGNEPLKIYYKKWPDHEMGSVFWTYERNLPKTDPDRKDIAFPVWGNTWEDNSDPGENGIPLGEEFSYEVNVYDNVMQLVFISPTRGATEYRVDLSNNVDPNGNVDTKDLAGGYAGDWMYFKAGAYNQCSVKDDPGFWYPACNGTGDWEKDKETGDYAQVSFSTLRLSKSSKPTKDIYVRPKEVVMEKPKAIQQKVMPSQDGTLLTSVESAEIPQNTDDHIDQ